MALPPTIPTSFVPKQPVTAPRKRTSAANPFLALAYFIVGIAVLASFAVFGYQFFLEGVAKKKANAVITAQQSIDQATVTEFIRLRDRFIAAEDILNRHVSLSQFFSVLENLTLQGVRFSSLKITVTEERKALIEMTGSARTFNTLAAQSASFAADKRIKRAIFSGINVKGSTVEFELDAELDAALVVLSAAAASDPVPPPQTESAPAAATTTPSP